MPRTVKKPGSRARRNRRIKNWHIWLVLWVILTAAVVYGGYRILGPNSNATPTSVEDVGVVTKPTPSPSPEGPPTPTPTPKLSPTESPSPKATARKPPLDKSVRIVVYNNTVSRGYAARTADEAKALGWNVVMVENWKGSVPSSTVFYSVGLEAEARALAEDLGVNRVVPNHSGISLKGLSVVLRS